MSLTLQPAHCSITIHSNLLMKWHKFPFGKSTLSCFLLKVGEKQRPSGVTSVTEMHYILLECKKKILIGNELGFIIQEQYSVICQTVESGADESFWG